MPSGAVERVEVSGVFETCRLQCVFRGSGTLRSGCERQVELLENVVTVSGGGFGPSEGPGKK